MLILAACSKTKFESHDHETGEAGHEEHGHGGGEIENIRFTVFSGKFELFAEMTPLIKDRESEFVVHYTELSDFKPVTTGSLKIILSGAINETLKADTITRAGIFIIPYTSKSIGKVDISFVYYNGMIIDTIKVQSQKSYSSMEEAKKDETPAEKGITFLKEESWKIDFALMKVIPSDFSETVKATGKIINNPADEIIISSTGSGVVKFTDASLTPGRKLGAGYRIFSLKPESLREDNFKLRFIQAKSNFNNSMKEFQRVAELYKLKIISEREYLDAKSSFENSEAIYQNYASSAEGQNLSIFVPRAGVLKNLNVFNGQFVEAGAPLAIVANNNKLLVQIDIPAKEYYKLSKISDANLVIDNSTVKLSELNGKVIGSPISSASSGFITIYLGITNNLNLLPNTYCPVYLYGSNITNSIVIPKESIWEDQGNYFVFVQKHGELFEKRQVTINGFDGINYQIATGLESGEAIVTKGTYRVMLASKSSELPAQSHAH
jgi:RND family efflux transporter MFP subunit